MSAEVRSLPLAFYERRRAQGAEAGTAFEEMRARFTSFQGVPTEVATYKNILADAYQDCLCDELYRPEEGLEMEIARELERQGAFEEVEEGVYELTKPGYEAGETYARLRYLEKPRSVAVFEDYYQDDDCIASCLILGTAFLLLCAAFYFLY